MELEGGYKCTTLRIYLFNLRLFLYSSFNRSVSMMNRYVKSRSDSQLTSPKFENQISACKPEDDAGGQPIVPCGLIAWSMFNDTYTLSRNNTPLAVNKKGIVWKSDKEHKFGNRVFPKNFQKGNLTGGATLNPDIPVKTLIHIDMEDA